MGDLPVPTEDDSDLGGHGVSCVLKWSESGRV